MTEASIRSRKGMASVKDMPLLQDGPPPGGFPPVRYARKIPNSGPSGVAVFLVAVGVISWGFYQVGQGNLKRRAYKAEKLAARQAILPLIQAEEDASFDGNTEFPILEVSKMLIPKAFKGKKLPNWYHSRVPFFRSDIFVRERNKVLEEEAKVMANVPGWKVGESVYNSGRWAPPATGKLCTDHL